MEINTPMQVGIKLHRFFNALLWMHYNIAQAIPLTCTSLPGQPKRIVRTGDTEHDHPLSHVHILVMSDEGQVLQQQFGRKNECEKPDLSLHNSRMGMHKANQMLD